MRYGIIGTAGHVDHGKTCLIRALTGIDTDRLKEEKRRGITIELGFAWLDFPDGKRVGIVDVPGHEKFVKNMLAGAGGMDIAMLVIAADEGVMPQTVEHLDILSILGVRYGVIVLTKTDLAEPEFIELVKEDIQKLVKGTFLEHAPVIPVSVYKNEEIDRLKDTLFALYQQIPEYSAGETFRLPIDRVFSLKGFGTVVTGTLLGGRIKKGQEAVLYPENIPVKIRKIQVYEQDGEEAWPGQRVAVNIPDRKKEEIIRGDVLAFKASMYPTMLADVRLSVLRHSPYSVKNRSRVHVYHGAKELLGKVVLLDKDELNPGESGYAQLCLEEKTVFQKGERFVIRFYSPVETIGGGIVLDSAPKKHRHCDEKAEKSCKIKEQGTFEEMLEISVREHWGEFLSLEEISKRSALDRAKIERAAEHLTKTECLVHLEEALYIHKEEMEFYKRKAERFLEEFHKTYPLKEGMALEEVRSRLGVKNSRIADDILSVLKGRKVIKEKDGFVSRKDFYVVLKEEDGKISEEIRKYYLDAGFSLPSTELYIKEQKKPEKFRKIFFSLLNQKILIRLDRQYCIHREYYEKAERTFLEMCGKEEAIQTGKYRDSLNCSRKVAIALLEQFDREGFTRNTENGRILQNPAEK